MFDILTGLKNYLNANGISDPIYFEYLNKENECFYIFNNVNQEKKSAQNKTYMDSSDIRIVSRFTRMADSLTKLKTVHALFTGFSGLLTDSEGNGAVVQYTQVVNAPNFFGINNNLDSKEYSTQYTFNYLIK